MIAQRASRVKVGVLGATGAVGQTFIRLLQGHPWFELVAVAASERSAGKPYAEAARWIGTGMPEQVGALTVLGCNPEVVDAPIVFSALDAGVAGDVEQAFARAGKIVLSNARNHRLDPDVPLLIPEINADQLALIEQQRARRRWHGAIVTNANCAAIVIAIAVAPLHQRFGINRMVVTTMQAVSGAGYPGVPSLDILGNVVPYIAGEEEKIERELKKLLGRMVDGHCAEADIAVSAHANRVAVEHGHTACISIGCERRPSAEEALEALHAWTGADEGRALPSAPERCLIVTSAEDRPQPRRDADSGGGMSVVVGRVRRDPVLDLRLVALGHNTVRGAAGASILNAELLVARGLVERA